MKLRDWKSLEIDKVYWFADVLIKNIGEEYFFTKYREEEFWKPSYPDDEWYFKLRDTELIEEI
ncbi:hypothetical protein COL75_16635 [Bacillus wiedmannii]|uniref:hypothetical protein n=1 Tax=Bacillus wiedmannii TaxID=1890302 RepID=UPI000BF3870B|nr:hypothetical protein [Bacillus wiedmannii]PFZ02337.1 hypothetical protein COL75_16635 [Bacillus wiedmannii]